MLYGLRPSSMQIILIIDRERERGKILISKETKKNLTS